MRNGLRGSFLILLVAAGVSFGQAPQSPYAGVGNGAGAGPLPTPLSPYAGVGNGPAPAPAGAPEDNRAPCLTDQGCGCRTSSCWASTEYLLWWIKDAPLPFPFVLSGPVNGPPPNNNPGSLTEGGFPILGKHNDWSLLSGVRVTVGGWLSADNAVGLEWSGFLMPQVSKQYRFVSDPNGNPVLGFRYLDTPASGNGPEDIFQASIGPGNANGVGPFSGSLAVVSHLRLWGTEVNAVGGLADGPMRLQGLAGFRYLDLAEDLSLQLQSTALNDSMVFFQGNAFPSPAAVMTTDFFRTRNQFYGGQVGARGEYTMGNFIVSGTGKVALGGTHETIEVRGTSTLFPNPGPTMSVPVGQFAGPSNIGRRSHDDFAVVPEVELKLGYQLTNHMRATIGYNFLYISRVVRPGSQVDLVVNDSVNPTNGAFGVAPVDPSRLPQPLFNKTDFWAQGLNLGLELHF